MNTNEQKVEEQKKNEQVSNEQTQPREFKEERFDFILYVNDNIICKRNFKINNYIEDSMHSIDFKHKVDEIVEMIKDDLKSKSRVYTWYYGDVSSTMQELPQEMSEPLLEPWECTFKFVVCDNKHSVIEKIWDGYAYPRQVRERVDITNKSVKYTTKDGRTYSFDKETYFKENKDRLSMDMYILRSQIMDRPDLLGIITKSLCEICSPKEDMYQNISDYTLSELYLDKTYELDENGNLKKDKNGNLKFKKNDKNTKKYFYPLSVANSRLKTEWGRVTAEKTKEYFKNLF